MAKGNWEDFGSTIKDIVEDAVAHQDFTKLNQSVTKVVNDAADNIRNSFGGGTGRDYSTQNKDGSRNKDRNRPPYRYSEAPNIKKQKSADNIPYSQNQKAYPQKLYETVPKLKRGGLAMAITGYIFTGFFGASLLVCLLLFLTGYFTGVIFWIAICLFAPFFIGCMILGTCGSGRLKNAKRFGQYLSGLGSKAYCNISELAKITGKSPAFVVKDLRKMIQKGWFLQGHLEDNNKCLITDHNTFREYQELKQQREIINKESKAQKEEQLKRPPLTEAEQVIKEGQEYILEIRRSNDAIPGVEISAKISRMELLIRRIFERIEEHPEQLSDIRKMMSYYLPTTVKLLQAYEELDSQPVQGENIKNSKKEIEATLDTLIFAFEKLLDNLFQDTAWDVSSDISVLHTMLSQEGLVKNDFQREETK